MRAGGRTIQVAPSLMCADFLRLGAQLDLLARWQVDLLHLDIMDGHYVPNFTLGPDFCRRLAGYSAIPLDIHLMVENVDTFIPVFAAAAAAAGPDAARRRPALYIHPEVTYHPLRSLELIRDCGARPGIALDPAVPVQAVRPLLPHVELACLMAVNPGFAGQSMVPGTLEKIAALSEEIERGGHEVQIEVDGNVSWENIPRMVQAGANILVAGSSSLFDGRGDPDLDGNLRRLYTLIGRLIGPDLPPPKGGTGAR